MVAALAAPLNTFSIRGCNSSSDCEPVPVFFCAPLVRQSRGIRRYRDSPPPVRSKSRTGAWCGIGAASAPARSASPHAADLETAPSAATWPPHVFGTRRSDRAAPGGATAAWHPVAGRGARRGASERKRRAPPDTRRDASARITSSPYRQSPGREIQPSIAP